MDILNNLITDFSLENLILFFRKNLNTFKPENENYEHLFEDNKDIIDNYQEIEKIGEADINNSDDLLVIIAKTLKPLTDRTGKKRQFDIAKKILKEDNKDAAFFIFYDEIGNFRFSFIRANFLGTKRDFTDFKRYTYFVSPELTNNTFKSQISKANFNDLNSILEAFSVEPLNKQFYEQIAALFYSLIGGKVGKGKKIKEFDALMKLPGKDIKTNRKIYQEFAVRLIGRIIFVWFLKNKTSENGLPLIPKEWLTSKKVDETHGYYHALLEKLFFEILNKPYSKNPDKNERIKGLPEGHEIVPFLNGGLFEPSVDDFYVKGSLGAAQSNYALVIPDEWLFKFFETLEQFNFTIDENSINDQEVSIDPEMLGTIFENLLAEIDPDTEKSARKSTGSFYTPREIVDYMVVESLVNYLKLKTDTDEEILHNLFKENDLSFNYFKNREKIINAFNEIKILDPACGSGAFPMGALHKINTALQKLDPDAEIWKSKQLSKIDNIAYRKALKDKLDKSNVEYIRKLGIIQHSIYGVDIQPIATEISKLRSFLSLVVDEKINDNADNRGIYPLPNLEFKFVTANSLIGLHKEVIKEGVNGNIITPTSLDFADTDEDIERIQQIREEYLQTYGEEKDNIKKEFLSLQKQIADKDLKSGLAGKNKKAQQIIGWNPFTHEKSEWFDSKLMFGFEKFDILIGNPPFIFSRENLSTKIKAIYKQNFTLTQFKINLYILFLEKGYNLLLEKGVLFFITPNNWLTLATNSDLRKFILSNTKSIQIIQNTPNVFENASVDTLIIGFSKNGNSTLDYYEWQENYPKKLSSKDIITYLQKNKYVISNEVSGNSVNEFILNLKGDELQNICEVRNGVQAYTVGEGIPTCTKEMKENRVYHNTKKIDDSWIKYLDGVDVGRYEVGWSGQYIKYGRNLARRRKNELFKNDRLLVRQIPNKLPYAINTCFTNEYCINDNNSMIIKLLNSSYLIKYILAILNSKLISFWFAVKFGKLSRKIFPQFKVNELRIFPIIYSKKDIQKEIENIVNEIISKKGIGESTNNEEQKIDLMVYKLYDLKYDEVKIIDPEMELTKQEYENYDQ